MDKPGKRAHYRAVKFLYTNLAGLTRTKRDMMGADVRPNWQEREGRESLTGVQWP
jgi:hypothetical protein